MRIRKWIDFGQEVEIDITVEDIRGALTDAFYAVADDHCDVATPNRNDVIIALNYIAGFLNALTDEQIAMLLPSQKQTLSKYLAKTADRFKEKS